MYVAQKLQKQWKINLFRRQKWNKFAYFYVFVGKVFLLQIVLLQF